MPSLDTNILVRWMVRDSPKHVALADRLLAEKPELYVSNIVLIELEHVLCKTYKLPRSLIVDHLSSLLDVGCFAFNETLLSSALKYYAQRPALSFVDCLLSVEVAAKSHEPLYTFDKKLANQLDSAQLLQ